VAARCPRLVYICRVRGFAVEPALKLLISNPLDSRGPVAPALTERVSRPLVSNHTLRGLGLSSPWARVAWPLHLLGKEPSHLMTAVVAAVVRCGRAFSGSATTRIVGNVGADVTGCRGPSVAAP
jgi:hypothetical protein